MDLNILISSTNLPIILRVQFHNWFYFVCKIIYDLLVFRFLCVITANLLFLCIFWFIYTHFFVRSSWYFLWIYVIFLFLWYTNTTNTTAVTSILLLEIPFLAPFTDNYNTINDLYISIQPLTNHIFNYYSPKCNTKTILMHCLST